MLAAAITATGCGAGSNGGSGGSSPSTGTADASQSTITVSMFHSGGFSPANPIPAKREDDPLRQMLEKKANIDLQISFVPNDQAKQKLNTMVASGDIPDLIYMSDRPMAVQYYDQGITADIESVLNDYPELKARFSNEVWDALRYKGKILGTPGYEIVQGIRGMWIRNDWLKKLNLSVPETPEQLLNVMKAFTFNDPDGNGKNDTYGFVTGVQKSGEFSSLGLDALMLMYGVNQGTIDAKDGELLIHNIDPRMKEAIGYIKQVLDAKVVDPDWMTVTDHATLYNKFYTGKIGIFYNDWRSMELDNQKKIKDASGELPEWIMIPPMKGPHGDQYSSIMSPQNNLWTISAKAAKDPEKMKRIMTMMQYWFSDKEAYPYFAYGVKGINWDMVNGQPQILQENKANKELQDKTKWMNNYANNRRADDPLFFNFNYEKTSEFQIMNQKYVRAPGVDKFVTPDAGDPLWEDRTKFMNESLLKFITGKEPLTNWDSYIQTLESKYTLSKYKEYTIKNLREQKFIQ
jgi:putative aldouronate transport system substrate-binding protein